MRLRRGAAAERVAKARLELSSGASAGLAQSNIDLINFAIRPDAHDCASCQIAAEKRPCAPIRAARPSQKGQELVRHPKDKPNEPRFQITNISVAFLREQTGGQVKMTFTGSSLGYLTSEDAKLNVNVRAKGGASLHSWSFEISVKCADKDRPLTPLTHDVPSDVAANVFTNVSTVEIAEPTEANYPGVRVQRCS
jgi:hypothetical protein